MNIQASRSVQFFKMISSAAFAVVLSLSMSGMAMAREPAAREDYDTRWRKLPERSSVRAVDPNVYVYNENFARDFMMPPEWSSPELRNVDAVAMRVVADYGSCSWNEQRKGCELVPLRCEIDLYFSDRGNALPWHIEAPEFWDGNYWSSSHFLRKARRKLDQTMQAQQASVSALPFLDALSGRVLVWSRLPPGTGKGARRMELLSYDRIALKTTGRVSLGGPCDDPPAMLVLAPDGSNGPGKTSDLLQIVLPQSWRDRVEAALREAMNDARPASVNDVDK